MTNLKKILISIIFLLGVPFISLAATLPGNQGGTGFATTTAGNVGNCLQVAGASPLTWSLGSCGGGSGNSAWTLGSGIIYNATTTDSVLVGTTTPTTAKLYVQGSGTKNLLSVATSTGAVVLQILANGNVGVGSSTPTATLTVQGTSSLPTLDILRIASSTGAIVLSVNPAGKTTFTNASGTNISLSGNIFSSIASGNCLQTSTNGLIASFGAGCQAALVSGTNIKTINGSSLLGSGDLTISGGGNVTGSGSVGYFPYWDSASDLISASSLFQLTQGLGINTTTPMGLLAIDEGTLGIGSIEVTNTNIVGIGTQFLSDLKVGDAISFIFDSFLYTVTIATITDDSNLAVIEDNGAFPGDLPYTISGGRRLSISGAGNLFLDGERLSVQENNNIGMGTRTPTSNLQVVQITKGNGTVETISDTTLLGTGTQFLNTFKVGDTITVTGETDRTIDSITDDTHLTVTVAFDNTSSGLPYTLPGGNRLMVLGNGNIGVSTPSNPKLNLQLGGYGGLLSTDNANNIALSGNLYYDQIAGWEYLNDGAASALYQSGGALTFYITAAGVSNTPATLSIGMSVDNNGNMSIPGSFFANVIQANNVFTGGTMILDNGAVASSIFTAKDNGTPVFTIQDGGGISATQGYTQTGTSDNAFTGKSTFSNATYSALFTGGNVGIGISTPNYKLEVAGYASTTSGNIGQLRSNGTVSGANATSSTTSFLVQGTTTLNPFQINSSTGVSLLRVSTNGSVGLGTTTNASTLFVQGTTTLPTLNLFSVASSSGVSYLTIAPSGWQIMSGDGAPTISSCGTGTGTVTGNDQIGTITTATAATSCTMTFKTPVPSGTTLSCVVTDNSLVGFADVSSTSTTAVVFGISSALTGGNLFYRCGVYK